MKTLALSNGDLVVGQGGHLTISGVSKIRQELALALGEYFGTDRFHRDIWGSVVSDYLGRPIDDSLIAQVEAEVARVLSQYIAIQDQEIYQDYINGRRTRYATADVIREVTSINAQPINDSIQISITLATQAGSTVVLNRTVTL